MRLLGRLFLGTLGLVIAVPCGALALFIGVLADPGLSGLAAVLGVAGIEALVDAAASGLPDATALALASAAAWGLFFLVALPPTLSAFVGELLRVGRLAWYGGASGAVSAALPWLVRPKGLSSPGAAVAEGRATAILFVAGAIAGLAYWMVAGRSAGRTSVDPVDGRAPGP